MRPVDTVSINNGWPVDGQLIPHTLPIYLGEFNRTLNVTMNRNSFHSIGTVSAII